MLSRYNAFDIEAALRAAAPEPPFPPAADRAAWAAVRQAIGAHKAADIIAAAERAAATPIPDLPATLWLEFQRAGRREGFEKPRSTRRAMMTQLALAECLEGQGRFLDPLLDVVWAILEESSWSLPAHQPELTDMARHHIDLGVAGTAIDLAELDLLLGAQLDPLVGRRIRWEIDQRCFTPYLLRHDWWWLYNTELRKVNNWTAVCNAGVVGAALYLETDLSRLAEMIARAARSMDDFLSTFDADGGSSEGPGYWSYGFGNYCVFAEQVEWRTAGRIRFMDEPVVRAAAQFPLRTLLGPGISANFSDCDRNISFIPAHLTYLARRLDLPDLMKLARTQPDHRRQDDLHWAIRGICEAWRPDPEPAGAFIPARHDWFPEMMWLFARYDPADPDALVLAAKGGHNQEMHNQNDVGNFIVHVNGETLIPDVGRGRYTRAYFGPERYTFFVNSSRGHSVPRPNGQEQSPGEQHAAALLAHHADAASDGMTLELKAAYPPEADLATLKRTIALHRDAPRGWVEVVDTVGFATQPGQCESVITTFAPVEIGPSAAIIRGEKGSLAVTFDPEVVTARVEVEKDVDLALGAADVNCLIFAYKEPVREGTIRLKIEPR
ncbi:MAG: Heparinase II/III-like protein [Chloroflexi bacterium ADurb.Bin325]|nr:MAG: Heparinase II/III-like protein [Chloroflexi bacterium ADurb.Bin325]